MTCRYPIYSGAGNRFFLKTGSPSSPALIRLLCTQAHVDGFLYLEPSQIADAKLAIFNADGSRPTMCGNGLRCAIAYLAQKLEKPQITIATDQGVYSGVYFSWERVLVDMTLPEWNFSSHEIVLSGLGKVQVFFYPYGSASSCGILPRDCFYRCCSAWEGVALPYYICSFGSKCEFCGNF